MHLRSIFIVAAISLAECDSPPAGMEWVEVPGTREPNACDNQSQGCFGSVSGSYFIGKHEVTNAQYAEFLNAVASTDTFDLYNASMDPSVDRFGGIVRSGSAGAFRYETAPGREDKPVAFVSWFDALRFANWLHNERPTGAQDASTTEDGAYTFSGLRTVGARNERASVFLPNEDEWYKAAYYVPASESYHPYPFADGFDGAACDRPPGATRHSANCGAVQDLTDVGAYADSPTAHGTFDQGGNVIEWNETETDEATHVRGVRAGYYASDTEGLAAAYRFPGGQPWAEIADVGFRVAARGRGWRCGGADSR